MARSWRSRVFLVGLPHNMVCVSPPKTCWALFGRDYLEITLTPADARALGHALIGRAQQADSGKASALADGSA